MATRLSGAPLALAAMARLLALFAAQADEAPPPAAPVSCSAAFSPLCLPHPHDGLLKDVSVEAAPDCCAACAELAECASWELRGASKCILRSAPPGVGEPGPTSCVSNALAAPPPPAPPPPLPFVPTNNGNRFGVCKIVMLFSILSRCPSRLPQKYHDCRDEVRLGRRPDAAERMPNPLGPPHQGAVGRDRAARRRVRLLHPRLADG